MNNRPPRPILAAVNAFGWAFDRALTHLVPSAPRHVLEAENHRLRARNSELEWEVIRLSQIHLAGASCEVAPSADDLMALADAVAAHPSSLAADLADLDAVETFQDFLWLAGGDE